VPARAAISESGTPSQQKPSEASARKAEAALITEGILPETAV
jgi:hypothetical protein